MAYKVLVFDDCCHLYVSLDTGSTWTESISPPGTITDDWTDMAMAVNDGDYDTVLPVDNGVSTSYLGFSDNASGVELCTAATYPTAPILRAYPTLYKGVTAAITANGQTILVAVESGANGYNRLSTNYGANWTDVTGLPHGMAWQGAAFGAAGAVMYVQAGGANLYRSANAGATWTELSSSPSISLGNMNRLRCSASGAIVGVAAYDEFLYLSINGGTAWASFDFQTIFNIDFISELDFGMSADGSVLLVIAYDNTTSYAATSTNNGATWTVRTLAQPTKGARVCNVAQDGLGMVVAYNVATSVGSGEYIGYADVSTDGGAAWTASSFIRLPEGGSIGVMVAAFIFASSGGPGGGGGGTGPPPPVWTAQAPYLREMTYRQRLLGQSFDPTVIISKPRPGPLRIIEIDGWMN